VVRVITEQFLGTVGRGVGVLGIGVVAFLVDQIEVRVDLVADLRCERLDLDIVRRPDVHGFAVGGVLVEQRHVRVNDVLNVGEIARLRAVTVDDRRLTVVTPGDEVRDGHVRAHPWAVHGEIAESYGREVVHFAIGAGIALGGELRRAVGRDGCRGMLLVVGQVLRDAVDGGGRGHHKPLDTFIAASIEKVQCAVDVDLVVLAGILDARADAGLCRLMVDVVSVGDKLGHQFRVTHVALDELVAPVAVPGGFPPRFDVMLLDIQIVERVAVIQHDDIVVVGGEPLC